ncbi:MAG: UvrD-helicase domain-containing protein, partial [Pirellulaceae bacterium]
MARRRNVSPTRTLRHRVIRASAGTGKTFQLSLRYLQLLLQGVPPEQILATTFTRKAAGEILQRIVVRLAQAALDPLHSDELARFLNMPDLGCDACLAALHHLLRNLHRLRIGTL